MDNGIRIETPRLVLRRMMLDDASALLDMLSDERVIKFLPMFALADAQEARAFIERKFLVRYARADAGEREGESSGVPVVRFRELDVLALLVDALEGAGAASAKVDQLARTLAGLSSSCVAVRNGIPASRACATTARAASDA